MKKISNNATAGIIGFALVALFAFLVLATPAGAQTSTCKDVEGFDTNLEGNTSGEWGSIAFTQDSGPLILVVNEDYEVTLCIKKATNPIVTGPFGKGTYEVNYPGFEPADGFSHYAFFFEEIPSPPTTTTTTSIPTTTTTTVKSTTTSTTTPSSTTTIQKETTTSDGEESTTTTNPQETTTSAPSSTTTPEAPTTTGNETTGETLPYTGVGELGTLSAIGLVLLGLGALLLTFFRRNNE